MNYSALLVILSSSRSPLRVTYCKLKKEPEIADFVYRDSEKRAYFLLMLNFAILYIRYISIANGENPKYPRIGISNILTFGRIGTK